MKKLSFLLLPFLGMLVWTACQNARGSYIDLSTGERIKLEKDEQTGRMINAETKKPVYIYVNSNSHDTIYGKTGAVINGHVIKAEDGTYKYDEDYTAKRDDDYVKKIDEDGDVKIKTGDKKIKIDGKTGERKTKK